MARILENQTNALPFDATYPYGDILDDTGIGDGVPVDRAVYADIHQFFARMVDQCGSVILNDLPDNAVNGFQFYEALLATETTLGLANQANIIVNAAAISVNQNNIQTIFGLIGEGDFSPFAF